MPRYRFNWENVPLETLSQLANAVGLSTADLPGAMRARYGARPTVDFVREQWPTLRDGWMAGDPIGATSKSIKRASFPITIRQSPRCCSACRRRTPRVGQLSRPPSADRSPHDRHH